MRSALSFVFVAILSLVAVAWGNYRWHQGFSTGADAALCIMAHQVNGPDIAMQQDYCQRIANKSPPYFPDNLRPQGPPANLQSQP